MLAQLYCTCRMQRTPLIRVGCQSAAVTLFNYGVNWLRSRRRSSGRTACRPIRSVSVTGGVDWVDSVTPGVRGPPATFHRGLISCTVITSMTISCGSLLAWYGSRRAVGGAVSCNRVTLCSFCWHARGWGASVRPSQTALLSTQRNKIIRLCATRYGGNK